MLLGSGPTYLTESTAKITNYFFTRSMWGRGKGIRKTQVPGNHQHTEKFQTLGNSYLANRAKLFSYINTGKFLPLHLTTKKFLIEYITIKEFHLVKSMSKQDITPRGTWAS